MCLCDTPGSVMLLGVFCIIVNGIELIGLFVVTKLLEAVYPQLATREASALDWAYTLAFISYYVGSGLLSIGLISGANSLNRGLLQKVVLGTKIRLVVLIVFAAFRIYVLTTLDLDDPSGIGKAKLIGHRSMRNDSWKLDPRTMVLQSIIYLPGPHVLSLARKNPDNKTTNKKSDKKDKEDEENKRRQKIQILIRNAGSEIIRFLLEVFIVYRLDLFVRSLPK
nr:uncharacterized protein LOC129381875 [Dermacentor andersoni]